MRKPKAECTSDKFSTIMKRISGGGWEPIAGTRDGDFMAQRAVELNRRKGRASLTDPTAAELKMIAKDLAAETGETFGVFTRSALCRRK